MIYRYACDCGERTEEVLPMNKSKYLPKCRKCKKKMYRNYGAEHGGVIDHAGNYPMESDAAGVHPDQVPETRAFDSAHGVPTEYTKDGNPIFTSRGHRADYCRAHGLYDRNAGYGDAAPKNITEAMNRSRNPKVRMAKAIMAGKVPMPEFRERE